MRPAARRLQFMRITLKNSALLAGGLFFVAVIGFNQTAVHWRGDVADSHFFAYGGWCVTQGAVPYRDIWDNKPPGVWWFNALGELICGEGPQSEILICTAALVGTLLGFVASARTIYHPSIWPPALVVGGILLTHVFYQCGANRTETFVLTCETLAVLGYTRWLQNGRWRWLIWGGFFAGLAPLFKQAGLAALGACILHLVWLQLRERVRGDFSLIAGIWKPWVVSGAAFAAPLLLAAIVLTAQGALSDAYFAVWRFNRAYFAVHDATWLVGQQTFQPYLEVIRPLYGLGILAGAGVFLSLRGQKTHSVRESSGIGVIWMWLLFSAYLACVGPGRQPYHLMPTLAPLGLAALLPIHRLMNGQSLSRRLVAKPSLAVVLAIYVYVCGALGCGSYQEAAGCWAAKSAWWAMRREPPADYEVQGEEIRRLTSPEDRIYVWGWSPGTYRFARRLAVSRFATLEKLGHVGRFADFIYQGAISDLFSDPPAVFVISIGDLDGLLSDPQGDMALWIDVNYHDHGCFQGMHILVRRSVIEQQNPGR